MTVSPNKCPHCGIVSNIPDILLVNGYNCPICNKWVNGVPGIGGKPIQPPEEQPDQRF